VCRGVIYDLGPRARRIYAPLRASILSGERRAGEKLPSHVQLATEYGVAPMTMRHVLSQLEAEGLVSREHGRGTFVCDQRPLAVLIVDDDPVSRLLLREHVRQAGQRPIEAADPSAALAILEENGRIGLVLSDVRMPTAADGIRFIRTVRRRWAELPLAAVTGHAADLAELLGTADCPLLILSKPVSTYHLDQALRLVLGHRMAVVA
jgi:CheY-like chemotaxis protein